MYGIKFEAKGLGPVTINEQDVAFAKATAEKYGTATIVTGFTEDGRSWEVIYNPDGTCVLPPYGTIDGRPYYTRDDFIFASRHLGPIESDDELIAYAEEVTGGWYDAGWHRTFTTFYLSDGDNRPHNRLTNKEFARLKELQKVAQAKAKAEDVAREWRLIDRSGFADNSVEETYEDKNGVRKTIMVVAPHGDAC